MAYTKQDIATKTWQKVSGHVEDCDLGDIDNNFTKIFNNQYDLLLGTAMQLHSWIWTNVIEHIDNTRLCASDDARYQYKLRVPRHLKVYRGVFADDKCVQPLCAAIRNGYIYINFRDKDNPDGYLRYQAEPCEAIMPDYFVAWFVHFLAENMVMEATGDTDRLGILTAQSAKFLQIAKAADNKRRGIQTIDTGAFIRVRY